MTLIATAFALICTMADPVIEPQTIARLFESYGADFKDVQFIYEGTFQPMAQGESAPTTFQGSYVYRGDGATLIDTFLLEAGKPTNRYLWSLLGTKKEEFDASPDILPRVSDRVPVVSAGAPGVLEMCYSPERFFLPNFFRSHTNPEEFGLEPQGWEEVDGHKCLVVQVYRSPRPKLDRPQAQRSFGKFWLDLERNGHPLRIEWHDKGEISIQTSATLEPLATAKGRLAWFPTRARTLTRSMRREKGKMVRASEFDYQETYRILPATIKFDQSLPDTYFFTKKQSLLKSDESLAKLRRELDSTKPVARVAPPSDPESLKRRMDDALRQADAESTALEASSAARESEHWSATFRAWGIPLVCASLAGFLFYRLKSRR